MKKTKKETKHNNKISFYICNLVVAGGIVFYLFYLYFGFPIKMSVTPCYMHDLFHLYCFGCGGTRAVRALLHFHVIDSFMCNPLVFYGALVFLYYYIGEWFRYFSHPWKKYFRYREWIAILSVILLFGVFIIRNAMLVFWQIDYLGDLKQFWIR
ncbi:MAG: DUF2752 domain-containing protein [Lachnospiraceae bacterium]|nr:DUF2752 domain-containing protein [Lachnospiraceae bacterium]